jgi:hypothetical protein
MPKLENKESFKRKTSVYIPKCKWIWLSNQKIHIVRLNQRKQDSTICYVQETHLKTKGTHKLKVKIWKGYTRHADIESKWWSHNRKRGFKAKKSVRGNKGHYMLIKATIQQEDIHICSKHQCIYKTSL